MLDRKYILFYAIEAHRRSVPATANFSRFFLVPQQTHVIDLLSFHTSSDFVSWVKQTFRY